MTSQLNGITLCFQRKKIVFWWMGFSVTRQFSVNEYSLKRHFCFSLAIRTILKMDHKKLEFTLECSTGRMKGWNFFTREALASCRKILQLFWWTCRKVWPWWRETWPWDFGGQRAHTHTLARLLTYSCLCCFLYNLLPVRITRWNWGWHPTCFLDILCKSAFSLFTINLSHLIRLIEDGFPNPLTLRFSDISLSPFFFFLPLLHFLYVTLVNLESDMEKWMNFRLPQKANYWLHNNLSGTSKILLGNLYNFFIYLNPT